MGLSGVAGRACKEVGDTNRENSVTVKMRILYDTRIIERINLYNTVSDYTEMKFCS